MNGQNVPRRITCTSKSRAAVDCCIVCTCTCTRRKKNVLPRVGGRLWGRERKRWRARQHVTGGGAPGRPWWVCKQPSSSPTFVRRPATHTPRGASARTAAAESVAAAASDGVRYCTYSWSCSRCTCIMYVCTRCSKSTLHSTCPTASLPKAYVNDFMAVPYPTASSTTAALSRQHGTRGCVPALPFDPMCMYVHTYVSYSDPSSGMAAPPRAGPADFKSGSALCLAPVALVVAAHVTGISL